METAVKHLSPEEFAALDSHEATFVDLREPDEVLVSGIDGALNVPFSGFPGNLAAIPTDKPVAVFCRVGDWSEQVAEILADRGVAAMTLDGGFKAYRKWLETMDAAEGTHETAEVRLHEAAAPAEPATPAEPHFLDAKGLRCPGPIVAVADYLREQPAGTRLAVEATEDAFASDIRVWCERTGNRLDALTQENGLIRAEITKASPAPASPAASPAGLPNGKTFVVFSGDLDKTIAAFIMANGAAAMGRRVTMFFTFWGLNILRRPEKVSAAKSFIERAFGAMMPRGTRRLGLSRMNMLGAGPRMIRGIMKAKGIRSLEELIDDARAHGVRLVACQMSMDIMGIRREELIDGVELGGVATFLGSGEESDMSLFI